MQTENRIKTDLHENGYILANQMDEDIQLIPGIQFDTVRTFLSRGQEKLRRHVSVTPIIVDFRSLLLSKTSTNIVKGVSNRDLLHAVIALYNVSLPEMTPDILYSSVCDKWSRTVILLRDADETLKELKSRYQPDSSQNGAGDDQPPSSFIPVGTEPDSGLVNGIDDYVVKEEEDKFRADDEKPSVFAGVFSDTDDEELTSDNDDVDEEDDDEDDFSQGMYSFIKGAKERHHQRQKSAGSPAIQSLAIENRLVAATTFEKTFVKPGDRVVHLTLIAVRRRYRKCNIGEYLLSQVKNVSVVGKYDAVVVHADNSAIGFFTKYGFTDDVVLNSRWRELAEQYTQCTLMCYLPPFTTEGGGSLATVELDIAAMDNEIERWHQKSIDAYRAEVSCLSRLRHEVVTLRQLVGSQQQTITSLTATCQQLRHEKYLIEKEFLEYRLSSASRAMGVDGLSSGSDCEDIDEQLIAKLKQRLTKDKLTSLNTSNSV
jgi:ribosomal protein S18 acetylase RimI-like enzyme